MFGSYWVNLWSIQEGIKIIIIILGLLKVPVSLAWFFFAYYFLQPGNYILVWFERSLGR